MKTVEQQMSDLALRISQANYDYYRADKPTISDEEYDQLARQLRRLEAENPGLKSPLTPTEKVGLVATSFDKVKHNFPMLSLDNTFSAQEIVDFFTRKLSEANIPADNVEFLVEPKIDGLSLALHYNKFGLLEKAVTRGDGSTGDNVTNNARTIASIPKLIDPKVCPLEVRGEVYFELGRFKTLNDELAAAGEDVFANPRNAASGTMKRKDAETVAKRGLSFIAYQVVGEDRVMNQLANQLVLHDFLASLGFCSPIEVSTDDGSFFWPVSTLAADEFESVIKCASELRSSLPFEIDGLVVKIQSLGVQTLMGLNNRSPNWATSYKFPPEQKTTVLKDITVQVGRLGTLTPVAELEPVNLGGTVIRRATLHNVEEITRLGINIGDTVVVQKAADVIPQITKVALKGPKAGSWFMPSVCPSCGGPVKIMTNSDGSSAKSRVCANVKACPGQIFARLEHAVKKASLDIDGCGESAIKALIEHGVTNLLGLFTIQDVSFLGNSAAKRFIKNRDLAKTAPLWRKIHAFGINGIGVTFSKELACRWPDMADMMDATHEQLAEIVGPVAAGELRTYFADNIDHIVALLDIGVTFKDEVKSGPLNGMTFCITGALASGSREEVAERIENQGGKMKSSVGKGLTYLVVGDAPGRNKTEAADKYGIKKINEEALYALMGQPVPTPDVQAVNEAEFSS